MKSRLLTISALIFMAFIGFFYGLYAKNFVAYTSTRNESISETKQKLIESVLDREKNLYKAYETQINQLRGEVESIKNNKFVSSSLEKEYEKAKELAGMTEVRGKGIVIYISDKNAVIPISADNLLEYLNIIRYAGAKAISINNQRIISTTGIYQAGPNMMVNRIPINNINTNNYDYVIKAIGDPTQLYSLARITNGLYDYLVSLKMNVKIEKGDDILIPAYNGSTMVKYAKSID